MRCPIGREVAARKRGNAVRAQNLGASVLVAAVLTLVAACGSNLGSTSAGDAIRVVAAENFWGSLVSQLGGARVTVTSVVSDPNIDPHDYQSSASTARAFASAQYVVINGAGYDGWANSLLNATNNSSRTVLDVAQLLGKHDGDNPHFWYSPAFVTQVADRVTHDLSALDGAHAQYYAAQRARLDIAMQPYHGRIDTIKQQFSGRMVASTESIFVYMATALGLDLISPPQFMQAVAEGNDPPANTVTEFQQQLQRHQASVLVYNQQTATDVTTNLRQLATEQHIPVVGISETMQPVNTTFEAWMSAELTDLQRALSTAVTAQ
jgi:zinc/manganese transport system substrate-binding protein